MLPYIQHLLPMVEEAMGQLRFPETPASLYDPIRYFMDLPGKRIRPIFVLQSLELFRPVEPEDARAALATELFHNFSLVHDDIMDKADVRRGFPTVHIKWNEPTALLAGDAILVLAYQALLSSRTSDFRTLINRFNEMALAVCEGQQLDMDFSTFSQVELPEYLDMIDRKTAALIAFSFEMGGFLGGADAKTRQTLHDFGLAMGRCFQLRDDYLDLFGNESRTGKKRGGDIGNSKLTFPVLASMAHENSSTFLSIWNRKSGDPEQRISDALSWMESEGIPAISEEKLRNEMETGMELFLQVKGDEAAQTRIRELCRSLAFREK